MYLHVISLFDDHLQHATGELQAKQLTIHQGLGSL